VHDSRGIEIVNFTISLALSAGTLMASAGTAYRLVPAHFYPCVSSSMGPQQQTGRHEVSDRLLRAVPHCSVRRWLNTDLSNTRLASTCMRESLEISGGPIYKISCNYLTIMPKLRPTYDGRLIYQTSYEGRKAFLRYNSLAKLSEIVFAKINVRCFSEKS